MPVSSTVTMLTSGHIVETINIRVYCNV